MADRFFAPELPAAGSVALTGDEARHLARVARREVGDLVEVFDGQGRGFVACIELIERDRVVLALGSAILDRRASLDLSLLVAVPKGDRIDWLVEKATELGVTRLVPLKTERSVVDPRAAKIERLRRAVIEASKQCGRNRLMILDEPTSLSHLLLTEKSPIRLLADAGGLPPSRWPVVSAGSRVALAVGPEGGWTDEERRLAAEYGWIIVGLGPTRLRVETAAIAGSTILFSRVSEDP